MKQKQLLERIADGHPRNVSFREMTALVEAFGFRLRRVHGSHHIFGCDGISEQVNPQDVHGEAKPYQIREFFRLVERYNLRLENDE